MQCSRIDLGPQQPRGPRVMLDEGRVAATGGRFHTGRSGRGSTLSGSWLCFKLERQMLLTGDGAVWATWRGIEREGGAGDVL